VVPFLPLHDKSCKYTDFAHALLGHQAAQGRKQHLQNIIYHLFKGISKFRHVMLIPTNFQKCDCTSRFCPYVPQDHELRPVRSPFGWKALHHLKAPPNSPRIFMYRKIQHIVHLHCLFVLELFIYLHFLSLSLTPYLVDWPIVGRLVSAPHASGSHPPIKICQS